MEVINAGIRAAASSVHSPVTGHGEGGRTASGTADRGRDSPPQAENADSGAFNTAETAQEAAPTQTVADIYANRATRQQNIDNAAQTAQAEQSAQMRGALDRLSSDQRVSLEEVQAIPEIQQAYAHPVADDTSTINTPERSALRRQIAEELAGRGSAVIDERGKVAYNGPVDQGRQMHIVIGLPAAGKSSAVADPLSQLHHAIVVDSDEAKSRLPEYDNGYGAGSVHEESKAINNMVRDEALQRGDNIVLPIVGGSVDSVMKYIREARANGYSVYLHLNELSSNKAIGRALQRFLDTGRFIRPEILYGYGDAPNAVFDQIISQEGLVDGYSHYSNDVPKGSRPRLVRSSDSGRYNDGGVEGDSGANGGRNSHPKDSGNREVAGARNDLGRESRLRVSGDNSGSELQRNSARRGEQNNTALRQPSEVSTEATADGRDMGMSRAEVEREYQKLTSELERDMQQGFPWRPTDARMQRLWELGDWLTEHPESGAVYAPAAQTKATADGRDMGEGSVSPEDSTGAAPAGFDPVSQWQMEADEYHGVNEQAAQTTLENRGRAPMDIPTTDRNGRQVSKLVSTLVNVNITTNEAAADKMDDLLSRNQSKSVSQRINNGQKKNSKI